jgi:hypothetical protein
MQILIDTVSHSGISNWKMGNRGSGSGSGSIWQNACRTHRFCTITMLIWLSRRNIGNQSPSGSRSRSMDRSGDCRILFFCGNIILLQKLIWWANDTAWMLATVEQLEKPNLCFEIYLCYDSFTQSIHLSIQFHDRSHVESLQNPLQIPIRETRTRQNSQGK